MAASFAAPATTTAIWWYNGPATECCWRTEPGPIAAIADADLLRCTNSGVLGELVVSHHVLCCSDGSCTLGF
jgi:hypothetical protein